MLSGRNLGLKKCPNLRVYCRKVPQSLDNQRAMAIPRGYRAGREEGTPKGMGKRALGSISSGKGNDKAGAHALDAFGPDLAAVGMDDLAGDRKAKARATPRATVDLVETVKDMAERLRRHSLAGIGHGDLYPAIREGTGS